MRIFNETAKDYIQYYGMNASDFFGRKISWETCKQACVYETFNYSYAGVYYILIPFAFIISCTLLYFIFKSYSIHAKSYLGQDDKASSIDYNQAIILCAIFLYMFLVFFIWFIWQVRYAKGLS